MLLKPNNWHYSSMWHILTATNARYIHNAVNKFSMKTSFWIKESIQVSYSFLFMVLQEPYMHITISSNTINITISISIGFSIHIRCTKYIKIYTFLPTGFCGKLVVVYVEPQFKSSTYRDVWYHFGKPLSNFFLRGAIQEHGRLLRYFLKLPLLFH